MCGSGLSLRSQFRWWTLYRRRPSLQLVAAVETNQSYGLLLSKGLIRVGLPIPATAQFRVASVDDPYNCNTNPVTGLTSPTTGIVSIYRRPLPAESGAPMYAINLIDARAMHGIISDCVR
jgi:hypothetical protein